LLYTNWNLTLKGKLKRFFYIPPPIKIELTLDNDTRRTIKLANPVTKGGIIINKWVDYMQNSSEMKHYFEYFGKYNKNVKSIKVICDDENGVAESATIELKKVYFSDLKPKNEVNKYKKIKINNKNIPIYGQLEYLDTTGKSCIVKGYVYMTNEKYGCCSSIKLLAQNQLNKEFYEIDAHIGNYYSHYQKLNLQGNYSQVYFNSVIVKEFLPSGQNAIFISVTDFENNTSITPLGLSVENNKY
jgi:hypothetical protein